VAAPGTAAGDAEKGEETMAGDGGLGWLGLVALTGSMVAAAALQAHELGPFQVFGTFQRDGAFRLDVRVDEEHLQPAQLGGPAHATRYGRIAGLSGPTEQRFGRFLSDLADSLTLSFDGSPVTPVLAIEDAAAGGGGDPAAPRRATMMVTGWIPGGARAFTLKTSMAVRYYPLILSCEGDELSTWRWVEGGQLSPPFALAPRVVPPPRAAVWRSWFERGFAGVLPHGPLALLLVAAIFMLAGRGAAALLQLAALALGNALGLASALFAGGGAGGASPRLPAFAAGLSPALLESLVALSVTGLALVCLIPPRHRRPPAWPLAVALLVLIVGLLHGLLLARGFAAGAATAGVLPPPQLHAALAGFAAGALAAELAVLAIAFALVGLPLGAKPWYRRRVVVPVSCLIAIVGLYWSLAPLLG
jgi:hypothetical protein